MKATNMMREMMVAASLMAVAACGAVEPIEPTMDTGTDTGAGGSSIDAGVGVGSGSDAGSGSQMTQMGCSKASECGDDMTCNLGTGLCVSTSLSLSTTGFVSDGVQFWTNTQMPSFSGTFDGPPGTLLRAKIGTTELVVTIGAGVWSTSAPMDPAFAYETTFTITMTDPSGGARTLEQPIKRDTVPPVVTIQTTNVSDERRDSIEWTDAGPVHTHSDVAPVQIGPSGCPTVYKYPYLMDAQAPAFGSEANTNPLVWRFAVSDTKVASAKFALRGVNNGVYKDWTDVPVASQIAVPLLARGTSTNKVAALNYQAGKYWIDLSVTDWAGIQTTVTGCFNYQPLAAPLQISQATTAASGLDSWSLVKNSPVSTLISSNGAGVRVFEQHYVQHTAEPIAVSIATMESSGSYLQDAVHGYVPTPINAALRCSDLVAGCGTPTPPPAVTSHLSGGLDAVTATTYLVDDVTGDVLAADLGGTLPGRQPGEQPHGYTLVTEIAQVTELRPNPSANSFSEVSLGGLTYTGTAPTDTMTACGGHYFWVDTTQYCSDPIRYDSISALDHAQLWFSYTAGLLTALALDDWTQLQLPQYVPYSTFQASILWDSGDDDLPGPN